MRPQATFSIFIFLQLFHFFTLLVAPSSSSLLPASKLTAEMTDVDGAPSCVGDAGPEVASCVDSIDDSGANVDVARGKRLARSFDEIIVKTVFVFLLGDSVKSAR